MEHFFEKVEDKATQTRWPSLLYRADMGRDIFAVPICEIFCEIITLTCICYVVPYIPAISAGKPDRYEQVCR